MFESNSYRNSSISYETLKIAYVVTYDMSWHDIWHKNFYVVASLLVATTENTYTLLFIHLLSIYHKGRNSKKALACTKYYPKKTKTTKTNTMTKHNKANTKQILKNYNKDAQSSTTKWVTIVNFQQVNRKLVRPDENKLAQSKNIFLH